MTHPHRNSKRRSICAELRTAILDGRHKPGDYLPTEEELVLTYGVSRPTVAGAMEDLVAEGLISRRRGVGTVVIQWQGAQTEVAVQRLGLLIPGLGRTEIFEPICAQIAAMADSRGFHVMWGGGGDTDEDPSTAALALSRRFVEQRTTGVFFAPLELGENCEDVNRQILDSFSRAGIQVVLLDRDIGPFPRRSDCDLVCLDNLRGGYMLAAHFLRRGITRLDFLALPYSAQTITQRLAGVRTALADINVHMPPEWVHTGSPEDLKWVQEMVDGGARTIICANDITAAKLMVTLDELKLRVPTDVRVAGFDDVKYAAMLRVPLTTVHQPCSAIGQTAFRTMLERLESPKRPVRKIMLSPELIVRRSCGCGNA